MLPKMHFYASFLVQGIKVGASITQLFFPCFVFFFFYFFSFCLVLLLLFISQCLFLETIQKLALHLMAELWAGSGGGGVLLEPPERRSCRKHHLQSSRGLFLQFLTFAKLADLVACFTISAAATLLAVNPPSARWAHAATFSLLFTGIDSGGQFTLCWVLGQASHV